MKGSPQALPTILPTGAPLTCKTFNEAIPVTSYRQSAKGSLRHPTGSEAPAAKIVVKVRRLTASFYSKVLAYNGIDLLHF